MRELELARDCLECQPNPVGEPRVSGRDHKVVDATVPCCPKLMWVVGPGQNAHVCARHRERPLAPRHVLTAAEAGIGPGASRVFAVVVEALPEFDGEISPSRAIEPEAERTNETASKDDHDAGEDQRQRPTNNEERPRIVRAFRRPSRLGAVHQP